MERRLSAILAVDVVGYSRLIEQDEGGTFERLRANRKELFEPEIEKHRGRIFKLTGDGLLAEFGSVVDAVECAVSLQRGMGEWNRDLAGTPRIDVRIGINLGDVIIDGEDRHGEGVVIAARLQQLAEPGGIVVSRTVADHVKRRLALRFEPRGEERLKNIAEPVAVYRVLLDASIAATTAGPTMLRKRPRRSGIASFAGVVALAMIGGVAAWWRPWEPKHEPASLERMTLPLPEKPSIAVLPFTNMSGEPGQEHFADGMTDDLITDLSKVSGLFVIARNSTFVYKGKPVTIRDVSNDLGVRYVLEGSVQRAGDQLRVNAQLIDALSGGHVWADRFDGKVDDVFAVQDAFVRRIVEALEIRLSKGEIAEIARAKTGNIAAKEEFDEGWSLYLRFNATDNAAAIPHFKRAIELDPEYGRAYAALALVHYRIVDYLWFKELRMNGRDAFAQGDRYRQLASKYPTALFYTAEARGDTYNGRAEEAVKNAGRAIASDPNDPEAHIAMAWALTILGKPTEALDFVAAAMRLNPNYPSHYVLARGVALFAAGDLDQAAEVLREGFKRNPSATALLPPLASVLAQIGHREEARHALQIWRPGSDPLMFASIWNSYTFAVQWKPEYASVRERLYDGLRVASLPLDVTVSSLLAELKGEDPFGRQLAVQRLGWFGPAAAQAVPALIELLGDEVVRMEAVQSLGKIGPSARDAVPALDALKNESPIGFYAKIALKEIRGF
jgi:TolB-like protein/class 3 adenylate cyclase/Flp pilus assembly protein TadD